MGGKNCVIVDSDADLDDAVPAIVASAFIYGGQKCSAAARVLVHDAIADEFIERMRGAVELLQVGQAADFATQVPPLIERAAQTRVLEYQQRAEDEGRLLRRPGPVPSGWFVPPALAVDLPAASPVLEDEIFGPLLAVERVAGVVEACESWTASTTRSRAGFSRAAPKRRLRGVTALPWATSTSTARSRELWSAVSRLVAAGCRERASRPAARLPAPVHRPTGRDRGHRPPRARGVTADRPCCRRR